MPFSNIHDKITFMKEQHLNFLKQKIDRVSLKSGVYRMLDESGNVLYVGKAKSLRKRLQNYLRTNQLSTRILMLMNKARDIVTIETQSESEALLIENDLIKQFHPPFNILLKDDKTYPNLLITKEEFPRLMKHRGTHNIAGKYFGPFPSGDALNRVLEELQKYFGLRTCTNTYFKNRTRPCLLYQIKKCTGPCCDKISNTDYQEKVHQSIQFLNGKTSDVQIQLSKEMKKLSKQQRYEEAAIIRDKIISLNQIQNPNTHAGLDSTDIFGLFKKNNQFCILVFRYLTGKMQGHFTYFLEPIENDASLVLESFLNQFYDKNALPHQILLPVSVSSAFADTFKSHIQTPPFRGSKRLLIENANENAQKAFVEHEQQTQINQSVWQELSDLFAIPSLKSIDVFDNSHIQGTSAVGVCIRTTPKGFDKNHYRRFNLSADTVDTQNDPAMMRVVLDRYLKRGLSEKKLPDLILLDGGRGQLAQVSPLLEELGIYKTKLGAFAKTGGHEAGTETLYIFGQEKPIRLDPKSDLMHLIQRMRDEAHRFAITSHRKKRAKNMFHESLSDIEGIGAKRKKALLNHFGSIKVLSGASINEIMRVEGINEKIAKKIYTFYHN